MLVATIVASQIVRRRKRKNCLLGNQSTIYWMMMDEDGAFRWQTSALKPELKLENKYDFQ